MKKIINYILLATVVLSFTSCFEDDDYGSDASKVIPTIFDLTGGSFGFLGESQTYSVTVRPGSEFIWTADGAEIQAIDGRTDMVDVLFTQSDDLVTVSVVEMTAAGETSEASLIEDIFVFGSPCDWTIEMQDSYGDGWNGASISIDYDGIVSTDYSLDSGSSLSQSIAVPDNSIVGITFNSGDWDSEITFQILDSTGTTIFSTGPSPVAGEEIFSTTNFCE